MCYAEASSKQKVVSPSALLSWILSSLWFVLCALLVIKYHDLVNIFFAFVGCFLVSFGISRFQQKSSMEKSLLLSLRQRQVWIGMLACLLSLQQQHHNGTEEFASFRAVSIMVGYLAFDLWFANWNDMDQSIWKTVENASTLTIGIVLCCWFPEMATQYGPIWTLYKLVRLVIENQSHAIIFKKEQQPKKKSIVSPDKRHKISAPLLQKQDLWIVHGVAHDLRSFAQHHPGGREALELGRGRDDCTALFESYHPFADRQARKVLAQYAVGPQRLAEKIPATKKNDDLFYGYLKTRVAQRLNDVGIDPKKDRTAPWTRWCYYIFVMVGVLYSLHGYCFNGNWKFAILLGVFGWFLGALGHDAGHYAASRSSWINDWGVWGMSFLCNPIVWQHQHTYAHHSFTNEFEKDPDLHHFTIFLKVHRRFVSQGTYKNQAYWPYVVFAYTFVVFGTCLWIPLDVWRTDSLYEMVKWTNRKNNQWSMLSHLLLYFGIMLVQPFVICSSLWAALRNVLLQLATSGLLFGFFSQVNHLNEASIQAAADNVDDSSKRKSTASADPKISKSLATSWAVAQIETANNFAPQSMLWHFLSNGLNYQIEHHLFPSLNHDHLSKIAPVVQECCEEYGVAYVCYDTWGDVFKATRTWLSVVAKEVEEELALENGATITNHDPLSTKSMKCKTT